MYIAITIVIVILSVLLTLFVLVQNSKGGGLSAGFSSSNQIMGVRKTTDFVEKMTWGLVIGVIVLSIAAVGIHKNQAVVSENESEIKEQVQQAKQAEPGVVAPNFGENPEASAPDKQPAAPAKK
ncbi:MAG: preprotein translocase subunit SecG [Paludibacter sp.]|nr:preprotein translocase subunit SecG [Paludibacter sp.]